MIRRLRTFLHNARAKHHEIEFYKKVALISQHRYLDLVVAFRLALEQPEVDIRDDLDALIRELSDNLAVLEEHVV